MHSHSLLMGVAMLLSGTSAQRPSVNTATITDATAVIDVATSVADVSTAIPSKIPLQTTQPNPVAVVAPGAQIFTTDDAPTVDTDVLDTDVIEPTVMAAVASQDLFVQISSDNPANVLHGTYTHPVSPVGVSAAYLGTSGLPIQTNNFYGNLVVGDQTTPAYAMPYAVYWRKGSGLCAANSDSSMYTFGSYSTESTPGPHYYYSPVGNCPLGLSSAEMGSSQTMVANNMAHQSVDLTFSPGSGSGTMVVPLAQGNAFLTAVYTGLTPTVFGGAFLTLTPVTFKAGNGAVNGFSKYRVSVNNGDTWLIYLFSNNGGSSSLALTSSTLLTGPSNFNGVMQIAKLPKSYTSSDEAVYDSGAGTYGTQNVISGTASGPSATYTFDFGAKPLVGNPLLSFLYPHQAASASSGTATSLKLWSTVKGQMQAYLGNTLSFTEASLPIDIQFLPWSPLGNLQNYSVSALQAIAAAANSEAAQNMGAQTNLNSMYYSGKALAKFAQICLTIKDVLKQDASSCVAQLEQSIAPFIANSNIYPITYDTVWKGAISSCGDSGCDFGNAWYNDHHFHYGYFVYTAAVIAHIDSSWLTTSNKAYINTLLRDFANPSTSDTAFPQFRSFDWYAGHSWAHGINPSQDGKDEESSSEDYNAIYGMKLWGQVIGDASMEARGNLMLAVMRRSMQSYMLMSSDNTIEPAQIVPQYAAGITFMNKIDHTTYFGQAEQYIQGIHMIPLTPISAYIRTPTFVAEEWSAVIEPILSGVTDGWRGILMANLAIANSTAAYEFFSSPSFSSNYLDGGASLTWYLTYAAGLGGAGDFELTVNSTNGQATTSAVTRAPTVVTSLSSSTTSIQTTSSVSSSVSSSILTSASTSSTRTSTSSSPSSTTTKASFTSSSSSSINIYTVSGTAINVDANSTSTNVADFSTSQLDSSTQSASLVFASTTSSLAASAAATSATSVGSISLLSTAAAVSSSLYESASYTASATATSTSAAVPSVVVTLGAGNGQFISCSGGHLLLGAESDSITIYQNGSLACGQLLSFLVPEGQAIGSLVYDIDLFLSAPSRSVKSNFTVSGNTLLAFLDTLPLARRQVTSSTQAPLIFAYGSDNVVKAILAGQNTTLTTFVPEAQVLAVVSSTSAQSSATSSSIAVSPSSAFITSDTATTSSITTASVTFTGTATSSSTVSSAGGAGVDGISAGLGQTVPISTASQSTTTSTSDSQTVFGDAAGNTVTVNAQGVTIGSSSASTGVANTGSQIGGQGNGQSDAGLVNASGAQPTTLATVIGGQGPSTVLLPITTSILTTYTTSVNGQATVVTGAIGVQMVDIVSTITTTVCGQCSAVATVAAIPTAAGAVAAAVGSTSSGTSGPVVAAAAAPNVSAAAAVAPSVGSTSSGTSGPVAAAAAPNVSAAAAVAPSVGSTSSGTSGPVVAAAAAPDVSAAAVVAPSVGSNSIVGTTTGSSTQSLPKVSTLPISSNASVKGATISLVAAVLPTILLLFVSANQ